MAKDAQLEGDRVLLVGLGNPGARYEGTRHNVGFDVVSLFAERHGIRVEEEKFRSLKGDGLVRGRKISLLLPQTFMNRSGFAVQAAAHFWSLPATAIIVVHDDLDLALGKVRLKLGGGHGGHNGLRSIEQQLGTRDYFRVRLGIDRPPAGGDVSNWVLGHFARSEDPGVIDLHDHGVDAIDALLEGGLLQAQNRIHPL